MTKTQQTIVFCLCIAVSLLIVWIVGSNVFSIAPRVHRYYHEKEQDEKIATAQTTADSAFTEVRDLTFHVTANAEAVRAQAAELERLDDAHTVLSGRVSGVEGTTDNLRRRTEVLRDSVAANTAKVAAAQDRINRLPVYHSAQDVANLLKSDQEFVNKTTGQQGPQGRPGRTTYVRSCY